MGPGYAAMICSNRPGICCNGPGICYNGPGICYKCMLRSDAMGPGYATVGMGYVCDTCMLQYATLCYTMLQYATICYTMIH